MNSEAVAQYLLDHPQFFEEHLEVLSDINLPHPHGGRAISLGERQLLALREKNKGLEAKLHDIIIVAEENDALQYKLHEFSTTLFAARDLTTLQEMIPHLLRDIFAVPHAVLKLWQLTPPNAEIATFTDEASRPTCTHQAISDSSTWFGEQADQLHSFAYLPLHTGNDSIGLLLLASEDKQRFYPEMGTVYLQRIAETAASALHPYLNHS